MSLRLMKVACVVIVGGWMACAPVARARADEPILLKYKAAKGDKAYYKMNFDMKQTQTIMGMKLENAIKQETTESRVVDAVDPDGKATLKVKSLRRKMNADFTAAGKFEFIRNRPSATRPVPSARP